MRLGWRAERIEADADSGFAVEPSGGDRLESDAVVLAVPHERAVGLLPAGALRDAGALAELGNSPIVNLHVVFDRPVLDHEFAAAVCSPVQYVFDRTESSGLERGQCLAVSLSAADAELDTEADELRARFVPRSRNCSRPRGPRRLSGSSSPASTWPRSAPLPGRGRCVRARGRG